MTAASPTEPVVGDIVDGRYRLEELIGKGGMGVVFRARHVFTHQQVALKLIFTDGVDPDTMTRFLAEARVAATVNHPAIVVASDANRTPEGQLYIVMELLTGRSLRLAMSREMTSEDPKRIVLELLDAIAAAHAHGVVHRDLKPENIYLVAPSAAVKVLDFGIAKMRDSTPAQDRVVGTLGYMAPEQLVDSAAVDARADLWAVAVILYELISGARPFMGTRDELIDALAHGEPTPIRSVVPVSDEVAAFFETALARDPALRFQTAAQMAAVIRRLPLARSKEPSLPPLDTSGPTLGSGAIVPVDPGPTMGTGAAWVKPASRAPDDDPRPRTSSAPPIRTANSPALASTAIQSSQLPMPVPRRRTRVFVIGAIAIAVAAVVIGLVATRSDGVIVNHKERCTATCNKLDSCGLAQPACLEDCDRNQLKVECVEHADNCTEAASCVFEGACGAAPDGEATCAESLGCYKTCGLSNTACLCDCNRKLNERATLLMGRLYTCHMNYPTNQGFIDHCRPLSESCRLDDLARTEPDPSIPRPSTEACMAACGQLATCGLATTSCATECADGSLDLDCIAAAKTCGDQAACYWNKSCGRPVKTGATSCVDTVTCWAKNGVVATAEQCSRCYDQMTAGAALDFARYHACFNDVMKRSAADPKFDSGKAMLDNCQPLLMTCYGIK